MTEPGGFLSVVARCSGGIANLAVKPLDLAIQWEWDCVILNPVEGGKFNLSS